MLRHSKQVKREESRSDGRHGRAAVASSDHISDPVLAWRLVFVVAALVYVACNLVFLLLGTARRQRWDAPPDQDDLGE
ncbi:unnamed protein product [Plutella xylostella]|uniref:(diamondback moth) hypothetical protein n=1 Tax=Plutella xylostella TaxID=51655 RepID=A0A8S4GF98_PLUXY|nr:unnamed protein product [Plutella xylostella]